MNPSLLIRIALFIPLICSCKSTPEKSTDNLFPTHHPKDSVSIKFPKELVEFTSYQLNPVFDGTHQNTWDENIRERGYILRENNQYYLWYTGYRKGNNQSMSLGLAVSDDGYSWKRHPDNPIYDSLWTEDMMVIKVDSTYYMFAEGKDDIAHLLISTNRIHWVDRGSLDIRYTDGRPLTQGPFGTPTVWLEDDIWYLFYERNDEGIWLARSHDLRVWTNIQDDPVLEMGQEGYDRYGVAMNQVIKYKNMYYGYYHGTALKDWSEWSTNIAVSPDLIHWTKYGGNPILKENKSSGILVDDGAQFRFFTMHPEVCLHFSKKIN